MEQYIFCFSSLIYDILSSATISHFLTFFAAEFFRYFLLYACHYFLWKFLTIPKFQSEKLSCISVEMHSIKNRTITFLQLFPTDHIYQIFYPIRGFFIGKSLAFFVINITQGKNRKEIKDRNSSCNQVFILLFKF